MKINRFILTLIISLTSFFMVCAQNYESDYYFVFITHDQTSSGNLIKLLEEDYQTALDEDQTWVFYLANGYHPVIVEVSPDNHNRDEFESLLETIGRNERLDCFPDEDMNFLLDYFKEKDFVDSNSKIIYNSVSWRIYTTPLFWNTEPQFIPNLFWVFDFVTLNRVNGFDFTFEVYINKSHKDFSYDSEKPFGNKNMGNINNVVGIMDYDAR